MAGTVGWTAPRAARIWWSTAVSHALVEEVPGSLHAPMPGRCWSRVVKVLVAENDPVVAGQALLVLEAMKMEHTLRAPMPEK